MAYEAYSKVDIEEQRTKNSKMTRSLWKKVKIYIRYGDIL